MSRVPRGEYRAVRETAGLLDRAERGVLAVTGGDRYTWLQGMISNDVRRLEQSEPALYACILDATGHLRTELRILPRDDRLLLDLPRAKIEEIYHLLEGFVVMEDVEVVDQTSYFAILSAQGPKATSELIEPAALATEALVVPADHTGSGGFDLYVRADRAEALRDQLVAAGAAPVGPETAETLRIEAGIPKFGVDMDEKTIPLEAGLEATHISHTKGCYVGQEVIARITARGHTNRALTGFVVDGETLPNPGDRITADEERELGWITSACFSPALQRPIALGYLRHEHREPGTKVEVLHDGGSLPAEVHALPYWTGASTSTV